MFVGLRRHIVVRAHALGARVFLKRVGSLLSRRFVFAMLSCFGFALVIPLDAQASDMLWDYSQAQLSGSGCAKDSDAFVIGSGPDLSLVFTNLGFSLGSSGDVAGSKTCNIKVPAYVPGGLYLARLDQNLLYGVIKSSGSEGNLRAQGKLFGLQFRTPEIDFRRGQALSDPQRVDSQGESFSPVANPGWVRQWCQRQRVPKGELQLHLKVQAKADSTRDDIIFFVDGMDLRYEIVSDFAPCS